MPPFLFARRKDRIVDPLILKLLEFPMRYLTIDGMLSGTGLRDSVAGGYVQPHEVGLSAELVGRIERWLLEYEAAHYQRFVDKAENERLDQEGVAITRQARAELPGTKFEYFSNVEMRKIAVM